MSDGDTSGRPGPTGTGDDRDTGDVPGTTPDVALTTAEAARVAGVSARTVRRWIETGKLPAVTGNGGVLYVFPHDLEAARIASHARPARRDVRDAPRTAGDDRDGPGDRGKSAPVPDPAGDAAGAILVAWRDTVLAPVVAQLAEVTRNLADARQVVGRVAAERDAARGRLGDVEQERDRLRAEVEGLRAAQDAPMAAPAPPGPTGAAVPHPAAAAWRAEAARDADLDRQDALAPWWRRWGRRR
jgi:excisionase family DNA binding protein